MQQYFIDQVLNSDDIVLFNDEQVHHIKRVLRMKTNDIVRVVDTNNNIFNVSLKISDDVSGSIISKIDDNTKSKVRITLIASLIKKDKWDFLLQKASELGVDTIVPLQSIRCVVKEDDKIERKLERWNKICMEACEQSKRSSIAKVSKPIRINEVKNYLSDLNIVAYEDADFKSELLKDKLNDDVTSITILVGCEGGLDIKEINFLESIGFSRVSLGARILRAETASMYLLSCIDYRYSVGNNNG